MAAQEGKVDVIRLLIEAEAQVDMEAKVRMQHNMCIHPPSCRYSWLYLLYICGMDFTHILLTCTCR